MIVYLLKSIACLLVLLLVHRLLLQRETMHRFNRFFLLFSVVVSFLIPLYTIEVPQEIAAPMEAVSEPIFFEATTSDVISEPVYSEEISQEQVIAVEAESQFNWGYLLFGFYTLISFVFLYRFGRNIKVLVNKIQRNIKINYRGQTLVLLKEDSLPFSFLKYIFVAESDLETGKFTDAVFAHECTHIKEKHSWDNLFIEALLVPLWFHPGLHWAKASIKLNHEFIADQIALRSTPIEKYESQLLAMMLSEQKYGLASSLNFSLTKKRFEMMKRKSNNSSTWIKVIALVPVLGALVYFFSERVTARADTKNAMSEVYVNTANTKYLDDIEFDLILEIKPDGTLFFENEEYNLESVKDLIIDKKAVKDDLKINLIANSASSMGDLSDVQTLFRELDIRKIHYVSYKQTENDSTNIKFGAINKYTIESQDQLPKLTPEQIEKKDRYYKNASFFVENEAGELVAKSYDELSEFEKLHLMPPMKAPAKQQPSSDDFESWKNSENFALWLDGKVIPNSQLETLTPSDIVRFFSSFVHLNARSERFPQEHQVHLYSNEAYEKTYGTKSAFGKPMTMDDKLYIYPRDNRINFGKPWGKKEKDPEADQKDDISEKWPPAVKVAQVQKHLQDYKDANSAYEKLRNQAPHFVKRSKVEQDQLTEMFSELGSMYYQIAFNDKPKVERPVHPFAPYMKLNSNGEVYYKMKEDLTAEELSQLPPPPPPANSTEQVVAYKSLFFKYELMRQEVRNNSQRSVEDRELMFEMYNDLQDKFLAMAPAQRRQVKMVNFPYVRLEENGQFVFKATNELTPEQRALNNC